jgi:hypothetical protein
MITEDFLARGISAANSGDRQTAINYLADFIRQNPLSEEAWLWMGKCRESKQEKEDCFKRVLQINPLHLEARKLLDELQDPDWVKNLTEPPAQETTSPSTIRIQPTSADNQESPPDVTMQDDRMPEDAPQADAGADQPVFEAPADFLAQTEAPPIGLDAKPDLTGQASSWIPEIIPDAAPAQSDDHPAPPGFVEPENIRLQNDLTADIAGEKSETVIHDATGLAADKPTSTPPFKPDDSIIPPDFTRPLNMEPDSPAETVTWSTSEKQTGQDIKPPAGPFPSDNLSEPDRNPQPAGPMPGTNDGVDIGTPTIPLTSRPGQAGGIPAKDVNELPVKKKSGCRKILFYILGFAIGFVIYWVVSGGYLGK